MRQAGMVRAGGRSGAGNGEEDRKAEGGTADGRRTDGREAECRKRDGGMEKWVRPGGTGEEIGWICVLFC